MLPLKNVWRYNSPSYRCDGTFQSDSSAGASLLEGGGTATAVTEGVYAARDFSMLASRVSWFSAHTRMTSPVGATVTVAALAIWYWSSR